MRNMKVFSIVRLRLQVGGWRVRIAHSEIILYTISYLNNQGRRVGRGCVGALRDRVRKGGGGDAEKPIFCVDKNHLCVGHVIVCVCIPDSFSIAALSVELRAFLFFFVLPCLRAAPNLHGTHDT